LASGKTGFDRSESLPALTSISSGEGAMASLFTWNESYVTHLPLVDSQHMKLVGLINDLGEQILSAEALDLKSLTRARATILYYAKVHFGCEEALMKKAGLDPRFLASHLAAHQTFAIKTLALTEYNDGRTSDQGRELVKFLVQWLAHHILGVDQSMARQIHAMEGGKTAAEAFESETLYIQSTTAPLLEALGELTQVISQRNSELCRLNREIEKRVKQRTDDLACINKQLQLLSTLDDLTGLPNRRSAVLTLQQFWSEARRYGEPLSVLMLDADHFKEVNDNFGHAEGDALLRTMAELLRNAVRASDIVCRLGGDEFLVICPRTTQTGAGEVAKKILDNRKPFLTSEGVECWDGAMSIGLAEVTDTMTHPDELVQSADKALYRAKRQGGARMAGPDGPPPASSQLERLPKRRTRLTDKKLHQTTG
jgi:diguanylate cyclase (GGDEF)-like protein/hemerythrin-like metal-binding protein